MRAKPEFNLRGHKLVWGKLAENSKLSKEEAFDILKREGFFRNEEECPLFGCFACEAKSQRNRLLGRYGCAKEDCPLDWGEDAGYYCPCNVTSTSLFATWRRLRCDQRWGEAEAVAAKIRDLPLAKDAKKFFKIIK